MTNTYENNLTDMEKDVIGEVMNISMGSAATALSTVLDKKVNITTPRIDCVHIDDFEFSYLEPVKGVIINFVEGIDGANVLLLKEEDLKRMICHLLSIDMSDEFEFDEISTSAICEIMNQMMGSAASALATFLGRPINISPPEILDEVNEKDIREIFSIKSDYIASIKFDLIIDGMVESEFISALELKLSKEIVQMTMGVNEVLDEPQQEQPIPPQMQEPVQQVQQQPAQPQMQQPVQPQIQQPAQPQIQQSAQPQIQQPAQPQIQQPAQPQMQPPPYYDPNYVQQQMQPPPYYDPNYMQPSMQQGYYQQPMQQQMRQPSVNAKPYTYKELADGNLIEGVDCNNLDLIMSVPIQLTVELGRTKKKIKDIVDLYQGNIVELDKQAGDQVDIMANGRLIAKGDVVVVDDNYSVRITEIIKSKEILQHE